MTKWAPGTDLSGIDTMTGLPKGQSRPRSTRRGTVKGSRRKPPMRGPKPPRRGWEGSRPRPDMPSPRPPMGGGTIGGTIGAIGGAIGGRPKPPRKGRTVKGSRPRPPMPSPKPPMGGGRPPIRDRMEQVLQDRKRRDLLTGRKRPPSDKWGEGTLPPGYRRGPKDGLIKDPNYSRPPRRGGGIRKNDDFTRGSGMALQVITPWVNKETGETWNAPNSGYTPREGSGWERARGGGKSQEQIIAERKRKPWR